MTVTDVTPKGISTGNRNLVTALNAEFGAPFTAGEAAPVLGYTPGGARRFLAYLAERGWLVRVHHGLYATVPLDASDPAGWLIDPWIVASKLYGPSYYLGGWTACEYWDLTEQIFNSTVVFTTRRIRSREKEIQGFPLRLKHTTSDKIFGTRSAWRDRNRVMLSDPTRTLVDVLDDPSLGGGIRHVADVLRAYFESEHRDDDLLSDYILRQGNRTVFKRLGYLLEAMDIEAPLLIQKCQAGMSAGVGLLDPSLPARGPVRRRWNIRVNATIQAGSSAP